MAETNAERKKRRVVPNIQQEIPPTPTPSLPPNVVPAQPVEPEPTPVPPGVTPVEPAPSPVLPPAPPEEGIITDFQRGVVSGRETLRGLRQGFTGAVAGAVGLEDEARRRLAIQQDIEERAAAAAPSIERVQDVRIGEPGGFDRAAKFVAGIAGKQGVIFAPVVAGGLVGAAAAPIVGAPAAIGATVGAVGTGGALETGEAFSNIVGDPESVENLGIRGTSLTALGTGAIAGSIEAVPALAAFKRVGLLKPFQRAVRRNLARRVATGALSQAAIEGGTEAVQTVIQRTAAKFANENREILGEEGLDEILNATVTGAIFGLGIGGVTGVPRGRGPEPGSVEDQVDLEETLDDLDEAGGRSSDIEAEIDELGEIGQEIRDARVRPSDVSIFEDPVSTIEDILRVVQEEGDFPSDRSRESMFAAVRELEDAEQQLPTLLQGLGYTEEQANTIALEVLVRADEQEIEFVEDLVTARGQSIDIDDVDPSEETGEDFDQFSEGFQEIFLTRNHIFRSRNGKLGLLPSNDPKKLNQLEKDLNRMEREFPDIEFDAVGLGDAIVSELSPQVRNDPERLNRALLNIATAKRNEPGYKVESTGELDENAPHEFLNRWKVIRRTVSDESLTGADQLRLTNFEVRGGSLTGGFVTVGEVKVGGDVVKAERITALEGEIESTKRRLTQRKKEAAELAEGTEARAQALEFVEIEQSLLEDQETALKDLRAAKVPAEKRQTAAVRQPKGKKIVAERKPTKESDFVVGSTKKKIDPETKKETVEDIFETVDAVALTNSMLTKLGIEGFRSADDIANAFFNGLAALGNLGFKIDTANISDTLVVHKRAGKEFTYGEISKKGAGRIRARMRALKAEERRLKDEIVSISQRLPKAADPAKQRRMQFLIKKMRRRIKKIPDDVFGASLLMTEEQVRLGRLKNRLQDVSEMLETEDFFLDSLRADLVEIDEMLFDFRNRNINTLAVEELAGVRNQMDEIIQAVLDERTRLKQNRSPEGSFDAGGEFQLDRDTGEPLSRQEEIDLQREIGKMWNDAMDSDISNDGPSRGTDKGVEPGSPEQKEMLVRIREAGETLVKDLRLGNVSILTSFNEVRGLMLELDPERWKKMMKGTLWGTVFPPGHERNQTGEYILLMNPYMTHEAAAMESVAHEVGHIVFKELYENAPADIKAAILKEYEKWRDIAGLPKTPVSVAALSKKGFNVVEAVISEHGMGTETMAQLQERNPKRFEYIVSFEEWFADQVSRWFVKQPQPKKGLTKLEKWFKGVADGIRALYSGMIKKFGFRPARSVKKFMDSLVHNEEEIEILSKEFMNILKNAGLDSDTPAVAGVMQTLDPFGQHTSHLLRKALSQVLTEEERNTLYRYFNRVSVKRRLKELVGTEEQKMLIENSPLHATVFGYQMWISGKFKLLTRSQEQAAEAGITEEQATGPLSRFVARIFTNLFDFFAAKMGFVQESQQAEQILEAIREGYIDMRKAGQKRWNVTDSVRDTLVQRVSQTINDAYTHLRPIFDQSVGIAQQRLLDSGIPGLQRIARGYYAAVGGEEVPETFFEARRAKIGLFMNSYTNITEELRQDEALKADVLAALRNPKKAKDPDVKRIASAIFKFNRRFRNYLVAAGLDIGDRGPQYFPWVWDPRKVQEENDFVRGLLEDKRFEKEMNQWLKNRNEEIAKRNQDRINQGGLAKTQLEDFIDMDRLIDEIMVGLQQNEGYADGELNPATTGTTPWFSGMHNRALGFLTEGNKLTEAERAKFDGLFADQLDLIMMTYIRQGVKRAEYSRRFGARSEKLQEMLREAVDEGASEQQMKLAYTYIDAMNGVIGENTTKRIYKMLGIEPRTGEVINPTFRTFSSIAMVVQNLAVLPLATLTSLVDPVGILVRSQDMGATMAALRVGATEISNSIKNLVGNDPKAHRSELRKLAEGMGTIEDHLTNEALEWEFGSTYLSPKLKAANELFFKAIGLTQWTRLTRIMALAGGKEFIKRHVQRPNRHSARFLRQLNLDPADVRFDDKGDLLILSRMEREGPHAKRLTEEEIARDDRVRNALNRFVDEAILRPTAANRPLWASDPNFMLIFHLKSFMFTFHDRILRRAFQEMEHGNVAPLILLSAFIPAMLFADILRDLIRFGLDGNPRKAHWELGDHLWSATQRSGLNGIGQLLIDARQDIQFGGIGYESLAGPTADGIVDLGGLFAEDDQQQWRAFTRNLPGNAAWRHWFENGFEDDGRVSFQN